MLVERFMCRSTIIERTRISEELIKTLCDDYSKIISEIIFDQFYQKKRKLNIDLNIIAARCFKQQIQNL